MADPDKIPETQDDTQTTYDPTAQEDNQLSQTMDSSILSESQDFKLVDCEETQNETQNENQALKSKDQAKVESRADLKNVSSTEAEDVVEPKSPTDRLSIDEKKDDAENEKLGKSNDKQSSDDDDDFVQSSQQESVSPLKRQLSNLIGGVSQKRKADIFDDTLAKFPRTCSHEDALSNVRKKLEEAADFATESIKDTVEDDVISNLIIQETQESCELEKTSESLQQVEQELEEALSQHATDEDYSKTDDIGTSLKPSPVKLSPVIEKLVEEKEPEKEQISEKEKLPENEDTCEKDKLPELEATQQKEKSPEKEIGTIEKSKCDDESVSDVPTVSKASEKLEHDVHSTDKAETEKVEESIKVPAQSTSTIMEDTKDEATNSPVIDHAISKSNDCGTALKDTEVQKPDVENSVTSQTSTNRSRMSIEVIYDRATAPPEKKLPRELVEIDEDGEKIVLDSSHEGCNRSTDKNKIDTSYKTCDSKASTDYKSIDSSKESSCDYKSGYPLTNGSTDSKIADTDSTVGSKAGFFTSDSNEKKSAGVTPSPSKKMRMNVTSSRKIDENLEILSISDSDESFIVDERSKTKEQTPTTNIQHDISSTKLSSIEKELSIIVKLKCLVYVDEVTKEQVEKVITGVQCEPVTNDLSLSRRRNSDTSGLADISGNDNRDASPSSVTSNRHPYPLNARLSLASIASSSSSSSAGSIVGKHVGNNSNKFQLPRGPAKHAKKIVTESTNEPKKLESTELLEHIKKEWKNVDTVTTTLMTFASNELQSMDLHNGSAAERVVDNSLERIRSSTPEVVEKPEIVQVATPKRTAKRGRNAKASRSKSLRSSDSNGVPKDSPLTPAIVDVNKLTPSTSRKRKSLPDSSTPSRQNITTKESVNDTTDDLVGKEVFAKWSDNKYYPGTVTGKTKTKLRVNFYDGQNKMIIEDFVVPMPATLNPGLSVYATTNEDDYGSCGIIIDVKKSKDNVIYIVETDEREKVRVDIKNIFLTNDQVQVLKEETKVQLKSPPSTPKHLGKVSLDNVIDGKRRSKRVVTPVVTTPRGKRGRGSLIDKNIDPAKPSASGTSSGIKYEENYDTTSDSSHSVSDDWDLMGVQPEIMGAVSEQDTKGPSSGIKGKGRSRKRSEDPEIVASLGPIPSAKSDIFRGMSFILTCVSLDMVERYQADNAKDSGSDPGTENEEEWSRKPFVRERLVAQLTAGGGKIYEEFELVPTEDYVNTKLITNVPNMTKKALLCLSVGIKAYNHQWIIRCCKENKIVNPSEEELPAGWSLLKNSYVEMFQRRNEKPFQTLPVIVVMPVTPADKEFISFWRQICENAGGAVLPVDNPDDGFIEGTVVLTNKHCPSWVIEKASSWNIPLVSTTWIVECLIEGNICSCYAHPSFKYNYVKRSSSHISHLKRR